MALRKCYRFRRRLLDEILFVLVHAMMLLPSGIAWLCRNHGCTQQASDEPWMKIPRPTLRMSHQTETDIERTGTFVFPKPSNVEERHLRFASVGKLYGKSTSDTSHLDILERLNLATVVVVGLGGVGSWAAEALCRSGVGNLILIDLDDICISNTNRQVHALSTTVGRMKTNEMKRRILEINPECNVTLIHDFVTTGNVQGIFEILEKPTAVLDAIDGSTEKSALLATCADLSIPVVTCGGAAGKIDPTNIVCDDLTRAVGDKLLGTCKKFLRKHHGFERGLAFHEQKTLKPVRKWNIAAVYSLEKQKDLPLGEDPSSLRRCDGALGTACFVTGSYGFVAAARIVDMIANDRLVLPTRGASKVAK
jgi:tRNA threonylcarbamoyladenosine dehydratase